MTAWEQRCKEQPGRTDIPAGGHGLGQGRSPATLAVRVALPWVIRLRFVLLAGEVVLVAVLGSTRHASVSPAWAVIPIGVQLLSNLWLVRSAARSKTSAQHSLGFVFALDTLALTGIFAATGGPANPFTLLYLVQITLSAVILHKAWTWTLGALSTLGYGSLFWVTASVPGHAAHEPADAMAGHLLGMWIAFTLAAGVITFFIGTVSETLRRRQKEILNLQQQVARQERLASLVTLAAGAAHEMGTPLATIAIAAHEIERAASESVASELSGDARLIREQVERCREILARMSARGGEPLGEAPIRIQPKQLLARVKENLPEALRGRLIIETPPNLGSVELPVEATAQALSALVNNGFDASAGGAVSVIVSAGENDVRFAVSDHGEGMDPATVARVAEPFFTTKPAGKGMGLGAFLAHLFATRMGGSLVYDSAPGKGTTAMLSLPLHVR